MDVLGIDLILVLGTLAFVAMVLIGFFLVLGIILAILFIKTSKIIIPRATLLIVSMLEIPIKHILWAFRINTKREGQDVIDLMLAKIRNQVYRRQFMKIPYNQRAIFLPQCIRHKDCPAKLGLEGIECIGCGKCQAAKIKKEAEKLGYKFFLVPGGSFVRRMIIKHKPKAVIGLGCYNEIKEGTAMTSAIGIPTQGVPLLKDGCVGTTADWEQLIETMNLAE